MIKLPLEQRQNKGIESVSSWVQIVEGIFKRKGVDRQGKNDVWMQSEKVIAAELAKTKVKS